METLGQLGIIQYLLLLIVLMIAGPALGLYVAVRVLRDIRRIADALELRNMREDYRPAPPLQVPPPPQVARVPGIANSAFGR